MCPSPERIVNPCQTKSATAARWYEFASLSVTNPRRFHRVSRQINTLEEPGTEGDYGFGVPIRNNLFHELKCGLSGRSSVEASPTFVSSDSNCLINSSRICWQSFLITATMSSGPLDA